MYPDPTTLAQLHLADLRREAEAARRVNREAVREITRAARVARREARASAPSLLVRIRSPRLWMPARIHA